MGRNQKSASTPSNKGGISEANGAPEPKTVTNSNEDSPEWSNNECQARNWTYTPNGSNKVVYPLLTRVVKEEVLQSQYFCPLKIHMLKTYCSSLWYWEVGLLEMIRS